VVDITQAKQLTFKLIVRRSKDQTHLVTE